MFKRGDIVEILEEFQDPGDSTFTWMVLHDEEKGRVDITPTNIKLKIKPTYTLKTNQIKLAAVSPEKTQCPPSARPPELPASTNRLRNH